ncbi:MAG: hypothetical protein AB7P69_03155 [Candidatus Binatia bacterium]
MQPQRKLKNVVVGALFGVTVLAGCAAKQAESPTGYEAAARQAASAASRADQAAQRAETAAAKAEAAGQRAEQAAQRVEAAALKLEERFTKRMRK